MKHNMRINGNVKQIDCELGTGVLDKHGVEIFDGDIIRHEYGTKYKVRFSKGAFEIVDVDADDDEQAEYLSECAGSEFVIIQQFDGVLLDERLADDILIATEKLSGYDLDDDLRRALDKTVTRLFDEIRLFGTLKALQPVHIVTALKNNLEQRQLNHFDLPVADLTNIFCFVIAFQNVLAKTAEDNSED